MEASTDNIESFRALALQVTCYAVNKAANRPSACALMQNTINRLAQQIAASIAFIGVDCRLIVLPEYFLTGFPMGESLSVWAEKACVEMAGARGGDFSALDLRSVWKRAIGWFNVVLIVNC